METAKKYTDLAKLPNNMSDEVLDANYNAVTLHKYDGIAPTDENGLVGTVEDRDAFFDEELLGSGDPVSLALASLRAEAKQKRTERPDKL